jgi:Mn2+/Fe2+ NRAMP family transporter
VLAAVILGPGSITLSTIAGGTYGYELLWVPVVTTSFMIVYTWMSARIGLVTGDTLFQVARRKYGSKVAVVGGVFGFLAASSFQAGNTAAIGFASNALFGMDIRIWAALFCLAAMGLILMRELYDKLELLVRIVVGIMIVTFVGTLVVVGVDVPAASRGLIPSFPDTESIFLSLGIAASTFSIVAAVYKSNLMKEKEWGTEHLGNEWVDSYLGIAILGMIAIVILLTSAGAIYGVTDPVYSAHGMALQLEPLVGPAAFYLFTIGFFFASLSSLVVNPLIGATILVDSLGQDASMDKPPVKIWTAAGLGLGLLAVLFFEGTPVELLRIAQGMSVVAFPILGYMILDIARDPEIMGEHANKRWVNIAGLLGYLTILGIVGHFIREISGTLM